MKKTISLVIYTFFFLFLLPNLVQATTEQKPTDISSQVDNMNFTEVQEYWNDILYKYGSYIPENQKGTFQDFVKGGNPLDVKDYLIGFIKYITHEIVLNFRLLGMLILLSILSTFLQTLQNSFEKTTVTKVANFIVFVVLVIIALNSFDIAMKLTLDAVQTMIHFVTAILPIFIALIAATGGIISASFFHPLILFIMNTSGILIKTIILPLLFVSTLLSLVSLLSENYKVTNLAALLRNTSIALLGAFLTIFLAVVSVQGSATAISDGIAVRTAKFVTGNFIPVIGRVFTEAAETVAGATMVLKNTVGIAGVIVMLIIVIFPALKILAIALTYKIAAAILQPIGAGQITKCIDIIGKSILYLFASLGIVSIMFFLTLTVMIAASNLPLMVR
ncbi:MAG: spoIIIAE [Bacillales bacterium]|jgi:stage III sporulation protein AE|nr:spoIIIAE [Bacillales bacterium]